jgi:cytochrome c551/c552
MVDVRDPAAGSCGSRDVPTDASVPRRAAGYSAPAMIKVLVAAVLGTVVGIAVMVIVIVAAGTTTDNSSSVGQGALPVTTQTPGNSATSTATTPSSSGGGSSSTGTGGGGNAANGKTVFAGAAGCGSCHALAAAGTSGSVGPNLDSLASDAQKAGQPLDQFVMTSIVDPNKFVAPGYAPNIMPQTFKSSLSQSDLSDLVAFITQSQK